MTLGTHLGAQGRLSIGGVQLMKCGGGNDRSGANKRMGKYELQYKMKCAIIKLV